jgi:hypothetical protein
LSVVFPLFPFLFSYFFPQMTSADIFPPWAVTVCMYLWWCINISCVDTSGNRTNSYKILLVTKLFVILITIFFSVVLLQVFFSFWPVRNLDYRNRYCRGWKWIASEAWIPWKDFSSSETEEPAAGPGEDDHPLFVRTPQNPPPPNHQISLVERESSTVSAHWHWIFLHQVRKEKL